MRPLGNLIAIRPIEQPKETVQGSIIIVKSGTDPVSTGEIAILSEDRETALNVGDKVIYPTGAGTRVNTGEEELLLMDISKLMAVL